MNGYKCFYECKSVDVKAKTSYAAQNAAVKLFQKENRKTVKGWLVSVNLCEVDGKQVDTVAE
ncbi:MAG: hypothetical protein COA84_13580 [Robiginitomaculum sp.]|nr:MAG: hypothetical protein COA84_13580 [Robiginitomaculum sp.]